MTHRKKAPVAEKSKPDVVEPAAFAALGLSPRVMSAVRRIEFQTPTEIQAKFIPAALTGRNCIGRARTGTGKTAAFLLPIFEHFFSGETIHALILAPTRELTQQITRECKKLAGKHPPGVTAIYGGQPIKRQIENLRSNPEIIVATPGRVIDMHKRGNIPFHRFSIVVIDEVDRMFDMGFRKDISFIMEKCSNRIQTMFLSATLPPDIMRFADRFADDPIRVSAVDDKPSVQTLEQNYISVSKLRKTPLLLAVLEREDPELALIFTRTKRDADKVGRILEKKGLPARRIHGDMPQRKREQALQQFRDKKVKLLVATDLMGRGIDVPGVSHVINYDIPENPDDYLHRTGRSARMDAPGKAITFVTPDDGKSLTNIEMFCNLLLYADNIEGFDTGLKSRK
ncbi:MAG: DEAD/DEAH box helicase [Planctomycetes bacterium]|nr:DEAD/DEAH box helicase [Planctomycetota bacterium]